MKKKIVILSLLIPLFLIGCSKNNSTDNGSSSNENTPTENEGENNTEKPGEETTDPENPTKPDDTTKPEEPDTTVPVSSVSLNKTSLEMYTDDSSTSLVATVLPENATNREVTWSSSNNAVASVYEGNVTPLSVGSAVITVKTVDGNKTAQCNVTVKERVSIPDYVLHGLYYGQTDWTDKAMVNNPYSTTEYMIQGVALHKDDVFKIHMYGDTWYGYSAVKKSTQSGLVTAAGSDDNIKVLTTGVYDIYCDYNESDGGHIYIGKVDGNSGSTPSVVNVSGISLSHSGKYLLVRTDFTITATVYPNNATNKEVKWTSSDTSIHG